MRIAKLAIEGEPWGTLSLHLTQEDGSRLSREADAGSMGDRIAEGIASGREVAGLLPQDILRALRQWYHDGQASGTLAIVSESAALDMIPWERIPRAVGLPDLCTVRLLPDTPSTAREQRFGSGVLVAGWIGAPTLNLIGIQQELSGFGTLGFSTRLAVRVMAEPTIADVLAAWTADRPRCVHIAAPAVQYGASGPSLAISGTRDIEYVPLDQLLAGVTQIGPLLVTLNTCDGAFAASHFDPWVEDRPAEPLSERLGRRSVARILAERLGATTISWYGTVDDVEAADFARFFYSRLLEGDTAVEGLRRFNRIRSQPGAPVSAARDPGATPADDTGAVPVLWSPSTDALAVTPLEDVTSAARPSEPRGRGRTTLLPAPAVATDDTVSISVDFEPQRWLNPALLKNQRPAIVRLVLSASQPLRGVGVSITCDTGAGQSTVAMTRDLERGPQPVPVDHLHFPVLYSLIDQVAGRRWVNFTLRCTHQGMVIAETTHSVLWMGLSEWLDRPDMWHFIPAFVNPNAEGVLRVIGDAKTLLKRLDPTSDFDGYQSGDPGVVRRYVETIFCTLRDAPFELTYMPVPPLEVYLPDESMPTGQRVRTPNQVIEQHWGTCHDLAVLFASCLEQIGIHPLVVLEPGHTDAGFWADLKAWQQFWKHARANAVRMQNVPGRHWLITSAEELTALVTAGHVVLFDATLATDRNARFDDALAQGRAHLQGPRSLDVAVDVRASRQLIQPL